MLKKKGLLGILLGVTLQIPICAMAQEDGGGYGSGGPYNCPKYHNDVVFTFNVFCNTIYAQFMYNADDVEIIVFKNEMIVGRQVVCVQISTIIPIELSKYGGGRFTIYVKRGTFISGIYSVNLENTKIIKPVRLYQSVDCIR